MLMVAEQDGDTPRWKNLYNALVEAVNEDKISEERLNDAVARILTAKENIEMPVLLDNEKIDKKYMNELLRILGLEERKNNYPSQLSGGQQQRVSIGRALANKPSIILADEPTGNLDSKNSKEVLELLKYCAKKYNQTLILITHDINIAKSADRVITIEDGEITSDEVIK